MGCSYYTWLSEWHLFNWDEVPGNDSESLIMFLRDCLDIEWTERAEILKSADGKTVHIIEDGNSAEITIDDAKEKATLKVSDGRTHDLTVIRRDGKIDLHFEEGWECPLDALPGEKYCYWHNEEAGKEPTEEQLEELKEKKILGVYLKKACMDGTHLQGAYLLRAELHEAYLLRAELQGSNLEAANLQGANLGETNLKEADLKWAELQKADLKMANLREANLHEANLKGADLGMVELRGANFYGAKFTSKTDLDDSVLIGANLFHSYFDEAKSFRNATVFQNEGENEGDKEINEIVGDALGSWFARILENGNKYQVKIISKLMFFNIAKVLKKKSCSPLFLKPFVLDIGTIENKASSIAAKLHGKGLIRYAGNGDRIIFFDWSSRCVIKNPENIRQHKERPIRVDELADLLHKDGKIQSDFLYKGGRASLYKASYEVYNNLYNFYIANGMLNHAAHVHYRRGEAHRKLRRARGGWKNWTGLKYKMRSIFDLWILNYFTGYGDRIVRPVFWSGVIIGLFAVLFWLSGGIVKNVNGSPAAPDWVDYLYHSITTFTSLGYSNIQPNLAAGHLPQVLVAAESGLGILMMALIIFVVTYQVSR